MLRWVTNHRFWEVRMIRFYGLEGCEPTSDEELAWFCGGNSTYMRTDLRELPEEYARILNN